MPLSVFDLFTVGIGPSSSHTVGPMRAGSSFIHLLGDALGSVADLHVDVFGSLAATGAGHGTFDAILIGLEGCRPDLIEANELTARRTRMSETGTIILGDSTGNGVEIALTEDDMVKRPLTVLPRHTNALTITAFDSTGQTLAEETYYSVGGGFVTSETEFLEKEKSAEAGAEDGPESSNSPSPIRSSKPNSSPTAKSCRTRSIPGPNCSNAAARTTCRSPRSCTRTNCRCGTRTRSGTGCSTSIR